MEILGNARSIEDSIRQKYEKDINNVQKELDKNIELKRKEFEKQKELKLADISTATDFEVKKEHSKILSEENLKAKREFESAREILIEKVFKEAEKKAAKIAHSKDYIEFVKKRMPEDCKIIADSDFFKKHFGNIKVDKNIVGVKGQIGNVIYDFSLDGIINSKRDELRHVITKALFK